MALSTKNPAFPAKAGIHLSSDEAVEEWVPAFAGNAVFLDDAPPAQNEPPLLVLDFHVLVARERAHPHIGDRVLDDAWADSHQRAQIHHRSEHRPVDRQLLDLVEDRSALGAVA